MKGKLERWNSSSMPTSFAKFPTMSAEEASPGLINSHSRIALNDCMTALNDCTFQLSIENWLKMRRENVERVGNHRKDIEEHIFAFVTIHSMVP